MSIRIDSLKKYYGQQMGIEEVSLFVEKGEFYGFIGPNGAGKSTTLRILMNILFPSSGKAEVMEKDVIAHAVTIKHHIGYLPSEVNLYPDLHVREIMDMNIQYYASLNNDNTGFFAKSKKARVDQMIENKERLTHHLQVDLNKKFGELSVGNQKKVGYILSVLHDPEIILLDEPTNGLDPLIKDRLFEDLMERHRKGATIFFSSHNLDEVERYCNKVAFIKDGKIIQASTIESLKAISLKNVRFKVNKDELEDVKKTFHGKYSIEKVETGPVSAVIHMKLTENLNMALNDLLAFNLLDLTIESPSLEEIFKFYYEVEKG